MPNAYERSRALVADPIDTEENIGFVMKHLESEVNLFRLDVFAVEITRINLDGKMRWGVQYDTEVMAADDTLVGAVIHALDRSGHEWAD
jgi:hypothetical protein